jgi:TatD DNase family protein
MKIDIHRHAGDKGAADRVVRNLFHNHIGDLDSDHWYSVGLHPWHVAGEMLSADLEKVRAIVLNNRVIAIGETGLDKAVEIPWDIQKLAFEGQIRIAVEFERPIIIHCVRAYQEIIQARIKSKHKQAWIIHWFNASAQTGQQLVGKDFYLSFGHMLFNENSKAFQAFPSIPADRIFLETDDASYSIEQLYDRASELRGIRRAKFEAQIESNFLNCFGIKP